MPLILTKAGLDALRSAEATGIKEKATHMAVGDGNGATPDFTEDSPSLVNETWRGELQEIVLKEDGQTVEFVGHVPMTVGGWWIYEVAVYADDVLLAIGAHTPLYKPTPESPDKLEAVIYGPVKIANAQGVLELTVDPTKVLASQEHVAEKITEHDTAAGAHGGIAQGLSDHMNDNSAHGGPYAPENHTHNYEPRTTTGSIFIGGGAMTPFATDGAEFIDLEDANGMTRRVPAFANDKDRSVCIEYPMPSDWDGGTLTAQLFWNAPAAAVAGDEILFTLAAVAVGNGESPGAALGATVTIMDTVIAANVDHESDASGNMTVGGTPAAGRMVRFKLMRDSDYGTQPLADVVYVLGIRIHYGKA